jgi:futalosine hydrolase
MEGYAVLCAAQRAGVPAIEVRVIANEIEEEDRARWLFDDAFARLADVTRAVLDAVGGELVSQ